MPDLQQYETLLYQHEVLLARLRIREHYLGTVVKEVYENIGQMLSLIRIKLLGLHHDFSDKTKEAIDTSGEMVGKTIRDLRQMCRLFYPEEDIVAAAGFYRVLDQESGSRFPKATITADHSQPLPPVLAGEKGLLVFGILLELFDELEKQPEAELVSLTVTCGSKTLITLTHTGHQPLVFSEKAIWPLPAMNCSKRASLLGGKIRQKKEKTGHRKIILQLPNEPCQ
ncbi:MAG: hypothetical protein JNM88_21060 [Chitinophagaceae bacterium]|nr:hypothetical protein [Chitinophagaceae bacterium]